MVVNKYDDLSVISYHHFTLFQKPIKILFALLLVGGDRGSTVVKVLCYKSEGHLSVDFSLT
jgi:hypothetical protein